MEPEIVLWLSHMCSHMHAHLHVHIHLHTHIHMKTVVEEILGYSVNDSGMVSSPFGEIGDFGIFLKA